jgi:Xaa-Pro aminopeptidase
MSTAQTEEERAAYLLDAQQKAVQLFDEIQRDVLRPGVSEKTISDEIHQLATKRHGVRTHWHKRVLRSGPNTLCPFSDNPPDRIIEPGDILYVDLGPVFEAWEADFGRTYVLGDDPEKTRLRDALEPVWHKVKAYYDEKPDMTGDQLYDIACEVARQDGWQFGAHLAGHIIGSFPHERIPKNKTALYITKDNHESMAVPGKDGLKRHWILEIHLRHPNGEYSGFFEQLLTVS